MSEHFDAVVVGGGPRGVATVLRVVARLQGQDRRLRIALFAVSSGLVIAIVGSNEISLLLTGMILSGGAVYALWTRRDSRVFWTALLVVALAAGLVSILAPGNVQRYAGLAHDPMPRPASWLAAMLYLPWVALRLLYWLSSLGWWASAFILLAVTAPAAGVWLCRDGKFNRRFLLWPALWIGAIFVLNVIGFLINRYPLPERSICAAYGTACGPSSTGKHAATGKSRKSWATPKRQGRSDLPTTKIPSPSSSPATASSAQAES